MKNKTSNSYPVFFLVLCFSLFIFQAVFSQEMQTGSITGKIVDDKGDPLPGVSITVTGPALQGKMSAVTNREGVYRVPGLPPGSDYELKAELLGFETVIRKGIIVRVGSVVTIDLQTKPSELKNEVVVTAPSPAVDVVKSTQSTIANKEVLSTLPLRRNWASFLAIVPGAAGAGIGGAGWGIHGGAGGETSAVVDGIQANDGGDGGATIGNDTALAWDLVEEVEVITSGSSAEYSSSPFGNTVIVMKSGGNKLTGEFSLLYTGKDLVQVHLPDPDLQVLKLAKPATPVYTYDASAAVGGAIIKDRLWYMTEFRFMPSKNTGDFRPTVINGKEYSNYDKSFSDYLAYIKLTFQLASNLRGSVMWHYAWQKRPYSYGGWWRTNEANTDVACGKHNIAGNISWTIDSNTILDFKAGGFHDRWSSSYTQDADPDGPHFIDDYTGYQWGNQGPAEYAKAPSDNISLSLTKFVDNFLGGAHEFKAGLDWERGQSYWGFYMKQPLNWYYYDGSPYYWRAQNGGLTDPVYGDGLLEYAVMGTTKGASYETGIVSRLGGFLQDFFRINRLTVNAGLRFDYNKSWVPGRPKGAATDPVALGIGETYFEPVYGFNPYDKIDYATWDNAFPYGVFVSPRIGLVYDLFGNHKTALKASFAHQAVKFAPGWFSGMYPLTWRSFTFNWRDLNNNAMPDPPPVDSYEEAYGDTPLAMVSDAYLRAIDPNVKPPYVDEFNFGIEHELIADFKLSAHYIMRKRGNILGSVLWDEESGRYWYSYEKAPEWWIPFNTTVPAYGVFPAQEVTMYFLSNDAPEQSYKLTNIPEAIWKYRALEIAFNKRMSHGWQLGGSVNFSKNLGNITMSWTSAYTYSRFSSANSFVNSYGELANSRPLMVKLYGTFYLPYQIMFSFFYQHIEGSPWQRTVSVLPPEEWAEENNASTTGYTINVEVPGARQNEAFDNLDIRLQKDFNIGPGSLGFYVDVFNLLGAYTLTTSKNPGGTWRPAEEGGTTGTFSPASLGLRGYSGYRQMRFSILYRF